MNIPAKMRAAVQEAPRRLVVKEIPVPAIGPNDVLIKVKFTGICGTDGAIYTGKYSSQFLPMVPGHEFSGVVAATGGAVRSVREGDRVTADINMSCGVCFYCRRGRKLMCPEFHQLGIHCDGTYAEYVKAPAEQVHILPDQLSFEQGAFIEPVSCVIHSAKALNMEVGSNVAILGAGLGILHGLLAKLRGAAPVMLIEPNARRREVAARMGIDCVIDPNACDPVARVKELTGGRGADYVIEAVGRPETYAQAFAMSRPGGSIAAFGITAADDTVPIKPFDFVLGERTLVGSCAGVGRDWVDAMILLANRRIQPEPMFSMKVPLEELESAILELQSSQDLMKVFVSPEPIRREVL
jgi:threonine dehydrogenase-like Zn-dependent dehydrogenase